MRNIKATVKEKVDNQNKRKEPEDKDKKIEVELTEIVRTKQLNQGMGDRLKEVIIWSEILGPPLSKRKKRRYDGN